MEFVSHQQDCKIITRIEFRNDAPAITGKVFPFLDSDEHIAFSVTQNLAIRSENDLITMIPFLDLNLKSVSGTDVDQFLKATKIARDKMNQYHGLYNRFTQIDHFLFALDNAYTLGHHDTVAQILMLCPYRNDDVIDQALAVLLARSDEECSKKPVIKEGSMQSSTTLSFRKEVLEAINQFAGYHSKLYHREMENGVAKFLSKKLKEFKAEKVI